MTDWDWDLLTSIAMICNSMDIMAAVVQFVILMKVAVAVDPQNWIVHDGMLGWAIWDPGNEDFGDWFQGNRFSIVQIVYEMIPADEKTFLLTKGVSLTIVLICLQKDVS